MGSIPTGETPKNGEEKLFELGKHRSKGINAVKAEMAKCDVACSNCHRFRTFGRVSQLEEELG